MKTPLCLALLTLCYSASVIGKTENGDTEGDEARGIVFWNGGTIKFVVGWTIPVPLHLPFVTLFTHTLQMAYPAVSNATQISELLQMGLAKGVRFTKRSVYYFIDRFFSSYGQQHITTGTILDLCVHGSSPSPTFFYRRYRYQNATSTSAPLAKTTTARYGSPNRLCLVRLICELSQMSVGHSLAGELFQYLFKPNDGAKYSKAWERGSSNQDCNDFYYCPYANDLLSHFTTVQYL